MLPFAKDKYNRYMFSGFEYIRIKANTPGEAWSKLLEVGKYLQDK
jgi:hypothetical protein